MTTYHEPAGLSSEKATKVEDPYEGLSHCGNGVAFDIEDDPRYTVTWCSDWYEPRNGVAFDPEKASKDQPEYWGNVVPFPTRAPRRRRRTKAEFERRDKRPIGRQLTIDVAPDEDGTWHCDRITDGGAGRLIDNVPWTEAMQAAFAYIRDNLCPRGHEPRISFVFGGGGPGHGGHPDLSA